MKTGLMVLAVALLSGACAKKAGPDIQFYGSQNKFVQTEKGAFGGEPAIENSFVMVDGVMTSFFDPNALGMMKRRNMVTLETKLVLGSNARFSYVIEHAGQLLNFVTIGNSIHRMTSTDGGLTWSQAVQILPGTMTQWNPGVVVDASGKWHMLVEADETGLPNQGGVACYYYTSNDGDTWVSHGKVIEKCGNPYLAATSRGIVVIHGDIAGGFWQTTASTLTGTTWATHREKFVIGTPGVHVCDPHAIETNGKIILSVSVDQNSITMTEATDTFESLHERLLQ